MTETDEGIYFYNHDDKNFGFLSNFYRCLFKDPITKTDYCCTEQFFAHSKCILFDPDNGDLIDNILLSYEPYEIKKYGREIKNYDEEVWNKERFKYMKKGLTMKFSLPVLKKKLLDTGNKQLYEASPYDKIWGIGFDAKTAVHTDKTKYGQNLLGKCLMEVREELKK